MRDGFDMTTVSLRPCERLRNIRLTNNKHSRLVKLWIVTTGTNNVIGKLSITCECIPAKPVHGVRVTPGKQRGKNATTRPGCWRRVLTIIKQHDIHASRTKLQRTQGTHDARTCQGYFHDRILLTTRSTPGGIIPRDWHPGYTPSRWTWYDRSALAS